MRIGLRMAVALRLPPPPPDMRIGLRVEVELRLPPPSPQDLRIGFRMDVDQHREPFELDLRIGLRMTNEVIPELLACGCEMRRLLCASIHATEGDPFWTTGVLAYTIDGIAEGINGWVGVMYYADGGAPAVTLGIWCTYPPLHWFWTVDGAFPSTGEFGPSTCEVFPVDIDLAELPYEGGPMETPPAIIMVDEYTPDHPCRVGVCCPITSEGHPLCYHLAWSSSDCWVAAPIETLRAVTPDGCLWLGQAEPGPASESAVFSIVDGIGTLAIFDIDGDLQATYVFDPFDCSATVTVGKASNPSECTWPETVEISLVSCPPLE
jgi:hypothetical protein